MVPFFIVVGLLMLGGAIVAWATRPTAIYSRVETRERRTTGPLLAAEPNAFSSAPHVGPPFILPPTTLSTSDPFAHAPALSDLEDAPLEMRR